jgi:hypothetical protein
MKIKEYVLRVIIDEDGDEILHLSERYECEESEDIIRIEVKGETIETPYELQETLRNLDSSELALA